MGLREPFDISVVARRLPSLAVAGLLASSLAACGADTSEVAQVSEEPSTQAEPTEATPTTPAPEAEPEPIQGAPPGFSSTPLWHIESPGSFVGASDGRLVFAEDGELTAFDDSTGRLVWEATLTPSVGNVSGGFKHFVLGETIASLEPVTVEKLGDDSEGVAARLSDTLSGEPHTDVEVFPGANFEASGAADLTAVEIFTSGQYIGEEYVASILYSDGRVEEAAEGWSLDTPTGAAWVGQPGEYWPAAPNLPYDAQGGEQLVAITPDRALRRSKFEPELRSTFLQVLDTGKRRAIGQGCVDDLDASSELIVSPNRVWVNTGGASVNLVSGEAFCNTATRATGSTAVLAIDDDGRVYGHVELSTGGSEFFLAEPDQEPTPVTNDEGMAYTFDPRAPGQSLLMFPDRLILDGWVALPLEGS